MLNDKIITFIDYAINDLVDLKREIWSENILGQEKKKIWVYILNNNNKNIISNFKITFRSETKGGELWII